MENFSFDENAELFDAYVKRIRQVAEILNYGKPHILDVFKNSLPSHLYWLLFPNENLRQAVETTKRIHTEERLDRQLARWIIGATPF